MQVKWLKHLAEIETLKDPWMELEGQVKNRTIFSSYDWIYSWYRNYGGILGDPLVGTALLNGKLVGIAPFVFWKGTLSGMPVRRVDFAGHNSEVGEFLVSDHSPEAAGAFLDSLADTRHFDVICLNGMDIGSEVFQEARKVILMRGLEMEISDHRYALVDMQDGYEGYCSKMSRNFRRNNHRRQEKVSAAGVHRIDCLGTRHDPKEVASFLSRMLSVSDRSGKVRKRGRPMADCHRNFYADIIARFAGRDMVDLSILSINNQDVSFILALRERGRYYDITIAYDAAYASISPGAYLQQERLKALPDMAVHTFISYGDHEYKDRWATQYVNLNKVFIFSSSLRAYLGRLAKFVVQPTLYHIWRT